jgi:hypothetical protein
MTKFYILAKHILWNLKKLFDGKKQSPNLVTLLFYVRLVLFNCLVVPFQCQSFSSVLQEKELAWWRP